MESSLIDRAKTLEGNLDFEKAYPMLSFEEKVAVNAYTDNLYLNLNKMLRGFAFEPEHQKILEDLGAIIFNALNKMLPKYKGLVFRGSNLTNEVLQEYVECFKSNTIILHSFFTSTSKSFFIAEKFFKGNVFFTVLSKNGLDVSSLSQYPTEEEILFNRDTNFKVTSISIGSTLIQIVMEEN
jgi:hypothetical protein